MQSLSGSLEENVLCALVWDDQSASAISMQVIPELFTTRHFQMIAKAAIDFVSRYSEAPKNHLPDILEKELNKNELGPVIWKQIQRMGEMSDSIQTKYILNELDLFINLHQRRIALNEAAEALQKGDIEKADEALHKGNVRTNLDPGIWLNEPDQALSFLDQDEEQDKFSLGIDALDSRGIRPARKTLFVIMAPKKRGKSMALNQIGSVAALRNRQNVLHITLEMSDKQTAKRYVQSMCLMTKSEVNEIKVPYFNRDAQGNYVSMDLEHVPTKVLNRSNRQFAAEEITRITRGARRLLIKEFATGTLTIPNLIRYLDFLKNKEKFVPDLLIVDYLNLMHMNASSIRTETGRLFRELRGIAVERNMAVVTATQGNRSSEDAKVVGATHIAEDWSAMGTADIVITICRTSEEKARNLARLYVAAARDVPDQYMVQISQNYETCCFALDSIYMNKIADRDFKKMTSGEDDED